MGARGNDEVLEELSCWIARWSNGGTTQGQGGADVDTFMARVS
jgi:hypothetical protein